MELARIIKKIECLRQRMHYEVSKADGNFTDPKVVKVSQILDEALNKYTEFAK